MKGLLIKDMNLMLGNARTILPAMGVGVIYVFFTDIQISFAMGYMIMLFGMTALSTLAYDEENGGMSYLMTLPVSRFQYVLSKYLFLLLFMSVGAVVSLVTILASAVAKGIVDHTSSLDVLQNIGFLQKETWMAGLIVLMGMFLMNMFLMPIRYKFGVAMQQVMILAVVVAVVLLVMALQGLTDVLGIDLELWLAGLNGLGTAAFVLAAAGVCGVGFLVSLGISAHVIVRKEF
ncbi:MAG TPA: hypothetical protein DF613_06995 [Lachnospiraceae bacterium]|nr:hypothetical protein [Lachnospiraceae bacterium]